MTSAWAAGQRAEFSLRWIYHHMIEEYARHNGHADLIRGTGQPSGGRPVSLGRFRGLPFDHPRGKANP
jgi:hypothetical protein